MRAASGRPGWWGPPVLALFATVPVIVATGHAIDVGWTPVSDDGVVALRAFDVLSGHPPLVGQYSQTSPLIHEPTYSLGPMLYWLLAVPAHIGPTAMIIAMGMINAASVAGSVLLANRRAGLALGMATAGALVLMCRSLPVEVPYEVWNCWAGVFPFTLLLFLSWSVACGDHRLLPVLAVTASFVIQSHFTYLLPALAAIAVAVGGLLLWRRDRSDLGLRPWVIAAVLISLICWSAPVADQLQHRPGNLVRVVRLATDDHATTGAAAGLRSVAHTVGVPPWWLLPPRSLPERALDTARVAPLTSGSAIVVFAVLLALLVAAWRGKSHEAAAALTLSLLLCLAVGAVGASIPAGLLGFAAVGYVLTWTSPAGMWVWLTLAWAAWVLIAPLRRPIALGSAPASMAGTTAVVLLSIVVTAGRDYQSSGRLPPGLKDYRLVRDVTDRVTQALAGSGGVLLDVPVAVRNSLTFQSAITYALRREGLRISVPHRLVTEMGAQYTASAGAFEDVLSIRDGNAPPRPDTRLIVRNSAITITIAPAP
jgi:hypothetical protein